MLKIAQIGIGHDHAGGILRELKLHKAVFDIAGICLPSEEKEYSYFYDMNMREAEGVKRLTVEEILTDESITAVTIETTEKYLTKYALLAAKAGKHIHMDKPGGMELSDFRELIKTAKENRCVLHLGYMYRYNPAVKKLMQEIKNGELGEIISVEAHMSGIYQPTAEHCKWLCNFPGGMMFFLGGHLVDMVFEIMGVPERIVPFNKATGVDGVNSEEFGMAVMEYKNGASVVKSYAREIRGGVRRQLLVNGTKKTVEIRPLEFTIDGKLHTKTTTYWAQEKTEDISEGFERYEEMLKSFAEMAEGKTKNPRSYDYELSVYKCLLKACGIK